MELNKLRTIIKEELTSVLLSEALQSTFLRKLLSQSSRWDANALRKGFTKMGYDLNNYTDASVSKYNGTAKSLKKTKGIYVIIAKGKNGTDQAYYTGGRYGWTRQVKDGQILALSINGEVGYVSNDGIGTKLSSYSYRTSNKIGLDQSGLRSFKSLDNNFDFEIYHLDKPQDQEAEMKAKQALRQKQKFGATAFMNAKQFRDINIRKFQAILKNKAAKGLDRIPELMKIAVKKTNEAVEKAYENPTLGQYDELMAEWNGKPIRLRDLSYSMSNLQQRFAEILVAQNNAAKEANNDYGSRYYQDRLKELALSFKNDYTKFMEGKIR